MIYSVAVRRRFIARHYLIGGDWGDENDEHSHHYCIEVSLEGVGLNEHGYVADIRELDAHMDEIVARFRERTLNDLPEFAGLNPSIERLAGIICQSLAEKITPEISALCVRIFENDSAWAACRKEIA